MGLHNTAHYLKSKGRGRDTELVHMSKREIKGLQDLALAHGGTLSINPETGLVEAGFLEQILPVVAAAGLTYLTAGAAAPLMAGTLGATGAGIAAGAGAGALISGGFAAAQGKDVGQAALMGGLGGAISGGMGAYGDAGTFAADAAQKTAVDTGTQAVTQGGTQTLGSAATPMELTSSMVPKNVPVDPGISLAQAQGVPMEITSSMVPPNVPVDPGISLAQGQKLASAPASSYYAGLKPDQYVQKGIIQGLPVATLLEDKPQRVGPQGEEGSTLTGLSPNFRPYTPATPNPYYRERYPTYAAEGGVMQSFQAGGPVERMSQMNTAMNPQGGLYPQGMIDKTQYATPTQRPVSAELMTETPAYERSNPMLMASGGQINLQGTVNLDQGNMTSKAFPGSATVGSGMAPSTISPMTLPFMGMPATGGPGMGPQNHMYQPQLAVMPQQSISMASGGITGYAPGGVTQQAYLPKGDAGRFVDSDVSTRNLSAYDAAMQRNKKLMGRAGIKMAEMPKTGIKSLGGDFSDMAARGGVTHLGDYSDGGRLLKGPGDGMSDNIPATIGRKQPARLADGEFVVPADVVSHLGNGSTDAGAKKLYAMMDKIRKARTGKKKQAPAVKVDKFMPA
jgi:hypothetical protein